MTAPVERSSTDGILEALLTRVKKLESKRISSLKRISWSPRVVPCGGFGECEQIASVGGTDPQGYAITTTAFAAPSDDLFLSGMLYGVIRVNRQGGFNAGTGTQWLLPIGKSGDVGTYDYYPDGGPPSTVNQGNYVGSGYAWDASANAYTELWLRWSHRSFLGPSPDFHPYPCLEAISPAGALWGPAAPYVWATGDILMTATFQYHCSLPPDLVWGTMELGDG